MGHDEIETPIPEIFFPNFVSGNADLFQASIVHGNELGEKHPLTIIQRLAAQAVLHEWLNRPSLTPTDPIEQE